jgi:hypothetical protein
MSDRDKDAEILALRYQLSALERQRGTGRGRFTPADRVFLAALLMNTIMERRVRTCRGELLDLEGPIPHLVGAVQVVEGVQEPARRAASALSRALCIISILTAPVMASSPRRCNGSTTSRTAGLTRRARADLSIR